jgi:RNA polymerase sigma-70 factor, ECF subfamily
LRQQPRPPSDDALATLYADHAGSVERWVRRLAGPTVDAADVVHDVFLAAHDALPRFRGECKLSTWLFAITRRVLSDRRKRDRYRRWMLTAVDMLGGEAFMAKVEGTEAAVERGADVRRLYAALERLPENYRTVVVLFELEGMSCAEIAELHGTSVEAIWVRLHRGRTKLSAVIEGDGRPSKRAKGGTR